MSNYKRPQEACFSFSHSKKNSRELTHSTQRLTSQEQRGLVGWICSILQPFAEEFLHALESSKGRRIADLSAYIARNYPHLSQNVAFFIIAFLVDVEWSSWDTAALSQEGKQSGDALLDIIIEQLGARFYRESQWLTKIMHIPNHQIFAALDSFAKGYITLRELAAFSAKQLDFQASSTRLIAKKLKGNLGGLISKIYQENLRELQLRADLTSFADSHLPGSERSAAYVRIEAILRADYEKKEDEKLRVEQLELEKDRMKLEELELSREDFRIRSASKGVIRTQPTPARPNHTNQPEISERNNFSSIQPHQSPKLKLEDMSASAQLQQQAVARLRDEIAISRRMEEIQLANLEAEALRSAEIERERERERALVRTAILGELEQIKLAKFHTRHQLCSYL